MGVPGRRTRDADGARHSILRDAHLRVQDLRVLELHPID